MRRDTSPGFWTVPAALLGLAGITWWAMQPLPPPPPIQNTAPAIEARGARSIIVREGGHKAWEFSADRITIAPNRIRASIDDMGNGTIFQAGRPLWHLRAKHIEANQLTRDLQVQDAVASLTTYNLRITTPRAQWQHQKKKLVCPGETRATMKNIRVRASAATYDTASGELRCTKGVAVSSPYGTLSAPSARAYPQWRRVEFQGGVDIVMHRAALLPSPTARPSAPANKAPGTP